MSNCVFCDIIAGRAPATVVHEWDDAIAIEPLNPVTPGHTLVIPRQHVGSFYASLEVSAATMKRAASLGHGKEKWEPFGFDANIITSVGRAATQTIDHLHVHIVPRRAADGLCLPWTPRSVSPDQLAVERPYTFVERWGFATDDLLTASSLAMKRIWAAIRAAGSAAPDGQDRP